MGEEIPLWIGGLKKWVTGVTKQTTCDDVVRAVLAAHDSEKDHKVKKDYKNYMVVERWRKVERPLDGKSRLLKVWKTWGIEQGNVRFLLKKAHTSSSKDSKNHKKKQCKHSAKSSRLVTCHPRKDKGDDHGDISGAAGQLHSLISSQRETISEQLQTLQKKDSEIEYYETQIHLMRIHEIGANYVQDTYLGESSEGISSCSGTEESSCDSLEQLDQVIQLYEKVLDIYEKLKEEEESIINLSKQLQQSATLREDDSSGTKEPSASSSGTGEDGEGLDSEIQRTREGIERLLKVIESQQTTMQKNERTLIEYQRIVDEKCCYLRHIQADLELFEKENLRIQEEYSSLIPQSVRVDRIGCEITEGGGDSNSDTGLSSLHSGSDDGAYALDTLV